MRGEVAAAVGAGVLAGALIAVASSLVPDDAASLPASRTVTATVPVPGPTVTVLVEVTAPAPSASPAPRTVVPSTTRASRSRTASQAAPSGFAEWLASPVGQRISWRESRNICDIANPSGKYRGKWQFDRATWLSNGGGKYAPLANLATCHEQDLVAYATWKRRGWQPWGE